MKTFVIPDVHGRYGLLVGLLQAAEVAWPEEEGFSKAEGVRVVQLGDLGNCVSRDIHGDQRCVRLVEQGIIDHWLVGNHEYPYLVGSQHAFSGFKHYPELEQMIRGLFWEGKLMAAYSEANILVTHAGLSRGIFEGEFANAREAEKALNARWLTNQTHEWFSAIPRDRGGPARFGGILWSDWMEAKARDFNQLFGHTPQEKAPVRRDYTAEGYEGTWSVNIDWYGKRGFTVLGAWINEDGTLDYVRYERQEVPSLGFYID